MSETDVSVQRMSLVGVNPNSRSLKFLNTKNNIAASTLRKQISMFEREKSYCMNTLETRRLDTKQFLRQVKHLEHEDEEQKKYLDRDDDDDIVLPPAPPPPLRPRLLNRRKQKVRLAQTAPAKQQSDENEEVANLRDNRKPNFSGPETQAEKDHVMKVERKKSMFLHLPGKGQLDTKIDAAGRPILPKPNAKTLLEVMIGLNAFSMLPSPHYPQNNEYDSYRGDSRMSSEQDSYYGGSHEQIAKKFMTQWKNKVASRKYSLVNRLESVDRPIGRESQSLASVPEDSARSGNKRRRRTRWTLRSQSRQPALPSIDDEEERKVQFLAWVQDEKDKLRSQKSSVFHGLSPYDKQAMRRKSFTCWLQMRQQQNAEDMDSSDEEINELQNVSDDDDDHGPTNMADLMRTILKIKSRFRDPLDQRVRRFNTEIEEIRKRDEAARNKQFTQAQKRRFKMLMHGIDAALADSSDEEDFDNYHTV